MTNPVLLSARHVASQAQHVSLNHSGIESAATKVLDQLEKEPYTPASWSQTPLHPLIAAHSADWLANWILLVSTLNFSFWSDLPSDRRFGVRWKRATDGKAGPNETTTHTGYWSLIAALHRANDEGRDVVNPKSWRDESDDWWHNVFRSDQEEPMPLLDERVRVLREVGKELLEGYDGQFSNMVIKAERSALKLVELVVSHFPCFDDRASYAGQTVYIRKRAQILVSELWAAFEGKGIGQFDDIDQVTMFADYRVPQILHSLSTISYSPELTAALKEHRHLPNGSPMEVEIRSLSIVAVDELRNKIAELVKQRHSSVDPPNAVLLDFLLWDAAKREEAAGKEALPHHRTRSVYY